MSGGKRDDRLAKIAQMTEQIEKLRKKYEDAKAKGQLEEMSESGKNDSKKIVKSNPVTERFYKRR